MPKLSIIITSYQAEKTIARAIKSAISASKQEDIEIIAVDDCSKDETCKIIKHFQKDNKNIKLYVMEKNSNGPSKPRNYGISKATGEYITFLDDDDELVPNNLVNMLSETIKAKSDFSKGYLICSENSSKYETNRLPMLCKTKEETIQNIITYQSLTQDFIVKKQLLSNNKIEYKTNLKIGEDTIFVLSVLCACKNPIYIDNFFLIYNKKTDDINNLSSTKSWSDNEIENQIQAWEKAEEITKKMSLSYYKLRLPAAFRNLLVSITAYSFGITQKTYDLLSNFANETKIYTNNKMNLSSRYKELYNSILSGNYYLFKEKSKKRLLISGYDLKFILPIIPYIEDEYNIKIDEWTGHNTHNKKNSQELLMWADIIWCEWLLGNAVYYSRNKNKNQVLIIRAHRFELSKEFGFEVDFNKVSMIFFVGYHYYESFIQKFNIPREKARLLSNYCESKILSSSKHTNKRLNIGIVGILPKRKGCLKALSLIKNLTAKNENYKLYIIGQKPEEVSWIMNNPSEKEYYAKCNNYIKENNLEKNIILTGFVSKENIYNNLDFVLSLSDENEPESFHMSPAEGACAGCLPLILKWPGAEYIYPKDYIFENLTEIENAIIEFSNNEKLYNEKTELIKNYIIENYDISLFVARLKKYLNNAIIMR